jgi:hypothetical protein
MDTENNLSIEFISVYEEIENLKILQSDLEKKLSLLINILREKEEAIQKIATKLIPIYENLKNNK